MTFQKSFVKIRFSKKAIQAEQVVKILAIWGCEKLFHLVTMRQLVQGV